ncbi:MAG: DUF4350 domain-containing protein [Opitutus sp.]|nr:DUF4350 domain-containing protein [Opitutus sp.]
MFQRRVAQGDLFPVYSSLRADPLGTRALHDALGRVPGLQVERGFKSIREIEATPARTLVLAGFRSRGWTRFQREEFDALDTAVRRGSRLVIALRAATARTDQEKAEEKKAEDEADRKRKLNEDGDEKKAKPVLVDLRRRWGAGLKERVLVSRSDGAVRADDAGIAGLPESVAWRSDLFFDLEPNAGWRVIYRRGVAPVLVERMHGLGSIVLAADAYFLSNEALQKAREPALLAWVIGPNRRVVFDEAHLGVAARPGVASLARRYGLSGAFFTLLLLAVLFGWRRMALFVPPAADADAVALTYHPAAGLEALLRRAVPPGELASACLKEWRPTARATDQAKVTAAFEAAPKNAPAVALYNAAVRALRRRSQ